MLKVTPLGSAPLSLSVGAGEPVAITVNDPGKPAANVVVVALVIEGAWVVDAKFAVTLCGAFMVIVVAALFALATLPVQLVKL